MMKHLYSCLNGFDFSGTKFSPEDLGILQKMNCTNRCIKSLSTKNAFERNLMLGPTLGMNYWPRKTSTKIRRRNFCGRGLEGQTSEFISLNMISDNMTKNERSWIKRGLIFWHGCGAGFSFWCTLIESMNGKWQIIPCIVLLKSNWLTWIATIIIEFLNDDKWWDKTYSIRIFSFIAFCKNRRNPLLGRSPWIHGPIWFIGFKARSCWTCTEAPLQTWRWSPWNNSTTSKWRRAIM